jgi:cytochrome P450
VVREAFVSDVLQVDPILALTEVGALGDPYRIYAGLRERSPVLWSDRLSSWVVTGHAECVTVLKGTGSFASDWRRVGEEIPDPMLSIQTMDPPEHTQVRHFMAKAFRAQDHGRLEQALVRRVGIRLTALRRRPSIDFVSEFAAPVALETISDFLGVPSPDPDWFLPLSQQIVDGMDAGVWPETQTPAVAARAELAALTDRWLAEARGNGLVGYIAAHRNDVAIAPAVLANSLRAVLHAGFESAGRLLGNAMWAVTTNPGALDRLRSADLGVAVDELVRYAPPVQADGRACVTESRLGDQAICSGDAVTLLLGAANRDPRRFPEPDALRFDRAANPHLGFGRGAHSCLGSRLAVLQARVVFAALMADGGGVRTLTEGRFRRNLTLRGLARLDVLLT